MQSWLTIPPTGGTPAVPMLGASTVAHTSRDSPSVTALPPDEGVEMADVDSEQNEQSMIQYRGSIQTTEIAVLSGRGQASVHLEKQSTITNT